MTEEQLDDIIRRATRLNGKLQQMPTDIEALVDEIRRLWLKRTEHGDELNELRSVCDALERENRELYHDLATARAELDNVV